MATQESVVRVRARVRVSYFAPGDEREVSLTPKIAPLIDAGLLELLEIDGHPVPRPAALTPDLDDLDVVEDLDDEA